MITKFYFVFFMLLGCFMLPAYAANSRDSMVDAQLMPHAADPSTIDGKAVVYKLQGKAVLMAKGSPVEKDLKVGDQIQAGDAIYTEKESKVSIAFDKRMKNAVEIPANSKATFTSIEPTDIRLESGSIFSAVDGLPQGSTWKVTTAAAVVAVRGTLYIVRYETASGQTYAATVNVPDDGKNSSIEIHGISGDGLANVPEGKEILLHEGEAPSDDLVKDLDPATLEAIQDFFKDLNSERENAEDQGSQGGGTSDAGTGTGASTGGEQQDLSDGGPAGNLEDQDLNSNQPDLDVTETHAIDDKPDDQPPQDKKNDSGSDVGEEV